MLIVKDGDVVFEDYAGGAKPVDAHNLYSGTKSFSCAIAAAAIADGLLSLDEPVAATLTEWQSDAVKSTITLRQLLTLTSGIYPGPPHGAVWAHRPSLAEAIDAPMLHPPGSTFQYGAVPYQLFAETMRRKLAETGETPVQYLTRRILDPIGLKITDWKIDRDGHQKLQAGALLTAREWAKYGQLILEHGRWHGTPVLDNDLLRLCLQGSETNPGYGMTFWLPKAGGYDSRGRRADISAAAIAEIGTPGPIYKAAGVGGQRLYVLPAHNLVIVRQAERWPWWGWGFNDADFLRPLFAHTTH